MPRARVDGAELWYELKGSGAFLVQIGGAVSAHEDYAASRMPWRNGSP